MTGPIVCQIRAIASHATHHNGEEYLCAGIDLIFIRQALANAIAEIDDHIECRRIERMEESRRMRDHYAEDFG